MLRHSLWRSYIYLSFSFFYYFYHKKCKHEIRKYRIKCWRSLFFTGDSLFCVWVNSIILFWLLFTSVFSGWKQGSFMNWNTKWYHNDKFFFVMVFILLFWQFLASCIYAHLHFFISSSFGIYFVRLLFHFHKQFCKLNEEIKLKMKSNNCWYI